MTGQEPLPRAFRTKRYAVRRRIVQVLCFARDGSVVSSAILGESRIFSYAQAATSRRNRQRRRLAAATSAQAGKRYIPPHSFKILKKCRSEKINLPEPVDSCGNFCYNTYRWFGSGEMAEWFKALVLKTSDAERHRGFESLSLRQLHSRGEVPKRPKGLPC